MDPHPIESRIPGFYNLTLAQRLAELERRGILTKADIDVLNGQAGLTVEQADHMVENVVGVHALPLGIAQNFIINGREVLVPMVIEEPSVVAGASFMARLARASGGFFASADEPEMIGQMQVLDLANPSQAR